jgi:hypothetical protein
LRGSAAFLIVIFHLFNYSFGSDTSLSLVPASDRNINRQ